MTQRVPEREPWGWGPTAVKGVPTDVYDESGATTIEYTLVLAFICSISIFATIWLINVLLRSVAALIVNIAMYLTGVP